MTAIKRDTVRFDLHENPDREWLEKTWNDLEQRSEPNFFLSWLWIGTWLDSFVKDFTVLVAENKGTVVGLGIFVTQSFSLEKNRFKTKHYLHRTGVEEEDQIWIEYNDFLITKENKAEIRTEMLSFTASWMGRRDALVIGASDSRHFNSQNKQNLVCRVLWEADTYQLKLAEFKGAGESFLKSLSRNTRYQISRSLKKYRKINELTIHRARTEQEAKEFFRIAKAHHIARWGGGKCGSGFTNPMFVNFHQTLIERGMLSGAIELNHITLGDETIAVVYNFRHSDTVYFYLSAIDYSRSDPQFKPGMVSHYMLIERAINEGAQVYDFMGGSARYKASFANAQHSLVICQYEKSGIILSVESLLRSLKNKLMNSTCR